MRKFLIRLIGRTGRVFVSLLVFSLLVLPGLSVGSVVADKSTSLVDGKYYDPSIKTAYTTLVDGIETSKTGNYVVSSGRVVSYEYSAILDGAPNFANGIPINCSWIDNKNGSFTSRNNLFSITVRGSGTSMSWDGETLSWDPILLIDGKKVAPKSTLPTLMSIDPTNENYLYNTLEWDYGLCVRHLRVIEGLTQDTWVFSKDPGGTVQIKENTVESKGFIWKVEPFAYDNDGNNIPITSDKFVKAEDMASAVYPVTIDPTIEAYFTSSSDGYTYKTDANFYTSYNATEGTNIFPTSSYMEVGITPVAGQFLILRSFVYFNTSGIPDSANISEAILGLYGKANYTTADHIITIQSGMTTYPHDPFVLGDYNRVNYAGSGGTFSTAGFVTTGYNNISLSESGIDWINISGTTKFCLRSSVDIAGGPQPSQQSSVQIYSYEKGAGYRPFLQVTYMLDVDVYLTTSSGNGGNVSTPGEGTYEYDADEIVTIEATADANYAFTYWTGDTGSIGNVNSSSTNISMGTSNKSAIANFALNLYIAVNNSPSTWTINGLIGSGTIAENTTYYSNPLGDTIPPSSTVNSSECYFTVTNESSTVPLDLTVTWGNFSGGNTMNNSNAGTNGPTLFGGYGWYEEMTYSNKVVIKTNGSDVLYSNWTGSTLNWSVEILTRTDAWTSTDQLTSTIIITATQH